LCGRPQSETLNVLTH